MLDSDQAKELLEDPSRRRFLIATGSIASIVGLASGELASDSDGSISGGTMAIDDYYKIAEEDRALYVGPDALKSEVTPNDGDQWEATDTQVVYNGDGGDWGEPRGIGSESKPVPSVSTDEGRITDTETVTVNVPSDYDTIQAAVDDLAQVYRPRGVEYVINIESGHALTDGFEISQGYYGHIRITAEDSTVLVDDSHDNSDLFVATRNCVAPVLDCLIDGQSNIGSGIRLEEYSTMMTTTGTGAGVRNATGDGVVVRHASFFVGVGSDFQGADLKGMDVYRTSHGVVDGGNFSDAGDDGIRCVRSSLVTAESTTVTNVGNDALHATREGKINAEQGANLQNATKNAVRVDRGGRINCRGGDLRGADVAINASRGGQVVAADATVSDSNNPAVDKGIVAGRFVMIDAGGATITHTGGRTVDAAHASIINLNGADLSNAGAQAMFLNTGTSVNAAGAILDNASSNAIWMQNGSKVNLNNASTVGAGNIRMEAGSIINMEGCTTDSSSGGDPHQGDISVDFNTLTGSGIAFAENFETA